MGKRKIAEQLVMDSSDESDGENTAQPDAKPKARRIDKKSGVPVDFLIDAGREFILPLWNRLRVDMHENFAGKVEGGSEAIDKVFFSATKRQPKKRNHNPASGKSGYSMFHTDVRDTILADLRSKNNGRKPSQREVYAEVGERWRLAKLSGEAEKYLEAYKRLRASGVLPVPGLRSNL